MKIDLNNNEETINKMAQERWKEIVEDTKLELLNVSKDQIILIRQYFQLAYMTGQADMFTQIKEIYHDDVDLFETMFDDSDLN